MTVLATFRVTNYRSRTTTATMQMLQLIVISMVIVGSFADAQNAFTTSNESDSNESLSMSRALSATSSSSSWTQLFSAFSMPAIFGGQQQHIDAVGSGESEGFVARTFGFNRLKKKIAIGMLPVMFKVGIMVMVIFTILLLSMKGVFLGTLLLIINLGFILAKLLAWKKHGHSEHGGYLEHSAWPAGFGGGKQNNDIHVHIHNPAPAAPHSNHDLPYSAYAPPNHGPSIHIEPGAYMAAASSDIWPGYQRRQSQQYVQDYVDTNRGPYQAQVNPHYVPSNQWS